jgi:hypothetical protein
MSSTAADKCRPGRSQPWGRHQSSNLATDRRLGKLLPHQLANQEKTEHKAGVQ